MQMLAKKRADVATLILDKVDFKARSVIRERYRGHIRMLKNYSTKKMQQS